MPALRPARNRVAGRFCFGRFLWAGLVVLCRSYLSNYNMAARPRFCGNRSPACFLFAAVSHSLAKVRKFYDAEWIRSVLIRLQLFPVLRRRHPDIFRKHPHEMRQVVETDRIANFGYCFLRVLQQFAGHIQAVLRDELRKGHLFAQYNTAPAQRDGAAWLRDSAPRAGR